MAIGSAYADMGQPQQALDNYNQARRTFKDREDAKHEAKALFMIARVYDDLSEKKQALVYCYDALRRIQDSDPSQIIQLYMLIGTLFADLGRFDDSIQNLEKARAVLDDPKTEKSQEGPALVQGLTGLTYARAGNMQKALEFLTQARGTYHQLSDPGGEASALNHIGSLQETLGQKEDALQTYSLALQLSVMEITKEFLPILGTI
ncbi:MAG: hypothetical protein DMF69_19215 [Acidobacteria bacterium]|nr:MAG: hypothetical protein DMF69_19215 [Acidobacteriota bacterium]